MSIEYSGIELKPCPFCGGRAILESWPMTPFEQICIPIEEKAWYGVFCNDCAASGPDDITKEDAIAAWNRRTK